MKEYNIPFNKPYLTGKEMHYMYQAVYSGKISGNGIFTQKCQKYFEGNYGFKKALLTTSCTDALEMSAMLSGMKHGDEVIIPSFTFVSTAVAFVTRGAKIVFADSRADHPGIDEDKIESLVTPKTKAIVPVHYAGVACDMDNIMKIAHRHNLLVIEDAAHAVDSFYKGKPLGSIGDLATFSFHETKNVNSGEGGLLAINKKDFINRSEIIWEKGTNRAEFFRGEVNKYGWVDIGSSFLPSEIIAAYLWAQLENLERIQHRRKEIFNIYFEGLTDWALENNVQLPVIPEYATNNGHMFYMICSKPEQRDSLIAYLKKNGVYAVFHYLSLHQSEFFKLQYSGAELPNADRYSETLLRLPFYFELTDDEISRIINLIKNFK
ncbi:dTDP-4-amino-4,6-dideoxygalactose transaminase [Ignavibacteria bacterium CHB1]|nr:MAG: dTDP-4-amino-4,6-dideoxygalactose transaminase [Chlorobiota bacterium]MBV6398463.1 dTDP-4-amino-4,6-dideoxygalactose transaminase [Ignavibacteria bacterium]MCC6885697.1 dTDP-4-amino-4,6-dideoxygalactose transaminase [Ignavibacteriales bacterium]MCE7953108.1 dTDP-4-amino-4,6-dideoxygalactose transaminase [Chlorobi bacterium CHB7]MDL1887054.1 dTDP-4-amino-4,6-dideoxygalactose transaminase [Ignavibacteria bacterium CHB1]RIK47628.1 MAG: dTDP-4-amino-4,6-dideoxygalactose transaminase [Ignav